MKHDTAAHLVAGGFGIYAELCAACRAGVGFPGRPEPDERRNVGEPVQSLTTFFGDDGKLVAKMCCICFASFTVEELYVCEHGETWDMCKPDGEKQGCLCPKKETP